MALIRTISAYWQSKDAATAIEYGLIVGGIAVAIMAIVFNLGAELANLFDHMQNELFGCETSNASDRGIEKGRGRRGC